MALATHNLGRFVLGRPDVFDAELIAILEFLRYTEIRQIEIPILPNENICRFQISVRVMLGVHVTQGLDDLSCVEFGPLFGEPVLFDEQREQIATSDELHHEYQIVIHVEGIVH